MMLIMFLLVIGVAFLTVVERDLHFTTHQDQAARAHYLALSGLQYARGSEGTSMAFGVMKTITLPPVDALAQRIDVTRQTGGTITSRGYLVDAGGRVLAERTVIMPNNDATKIRDTSL